MNNETKSRFGIGRKIASMFLSAALLATTFTGLGSVLVASSNIEVSAAGSANLPDNIQDGNILHCFNWKLSDIKEALPGIAEAGFTSVQTSPLQGHNNTGTWFWLYQPTNFSVGNELGSYQDLKDLCAEADKYGIKVIVDVVANHLAGWNDGRRADTIDSNLNRDDFFHNQGAASNWNDRNEIIYKNIGMPDLASENEALQGIIFGMINSMKEAGVDGIRWDAAKHIGLPSEGCSFWKNVAALGMYNYGEILDGPAGGDT
ncbi:MAG: alpha-amylase family glycosyl hydrolase, partial [Acutalibacteraceae bacterium]|nr:alpha-amylase family glycosyl hydrolase [Acutalibacteraceae bacterium]